MSGDARGENEALFRKVNEQIEAVSEAVPSTEPTMQFLCECDDLQCHTKLSATRAEYESVRSVPTHFLVHADHVDPRIEHVVLANDRFLVVEKEGAAATEAEADAGG